MEKRQCGRDGSQLVVSFCLKKSIQMRSNQEKCGKNKSLVWPLDPFGSNVVEQRTVQRNQTDCQSLAIANWHGFEHAMCHCLWLAGTFVDENRWLTGNWQLLFRAIIRGENKKWIVMDRWRAVTVLSIHRSRLQCSNFRANRVIRHSANHFCRVWRLQVANSAHSAWIDCRHDSHEVKVETTTVFYWITFDFFHWRPSTEEKIGTDTIFDGG